MLSTLAIFLFAAGVSAQTASLRGRVLDSTGAVMVGAQVQVYQQGADPVRETLSNDTGEFEMNLPVGEYRLLVSAPDFSAHEEEHAAPLHFDDACGNRHVR
jgi:hypothetical protein